MPNASPLPINALFPQAQRITFNDIQEHDIVAVRDRISTGNSIKINMATTKINVNAWYRKNSQNVTTFVAKSHCNEIFLLHRDSLVNPTTPLQQEEAIRSIIEHMDSLAIANYDEVEESNILVVFKPDHTIMIDRAVTVDKFGWYTQTNMHLAGQNDTIHVASTR